MGPPTTSSTPTLDVQSTKDTYIPLFSGAPQDLIKKEWRKRISIYYKKMELTSRKAEAVLNLIGSLQGTAWKLVEDFNLDDAGKDNAWRDLLKKLDSAFQYDARVQLPKRLRQLLQPPEISRPDFAAVCDHSRRALQEDLGAQHHLAGCCSRLAFASTSWP